ncbi:DEAD/DEAH box helicase [Caproicibacterium amylolyticum]|uniref:DEAD/DEAH box helicase n=1 Tax=Caproicibacterium amylolyticum TaxID=2766537 RepID=A0A7G9WJG6_9FIRM|nr:DEAD/DEAH box helicase [Caproicibacterium amylolyticum]QNO18828.1 DEAD/DEAH box helicase [Caproicibacterium amylolyticum]
MNIHLREYQQECIDSIIHAGPGAWLAVMATGLGKTVTFANLPRTGRTLILSHRRELVTQPRKYFDCDYGIELGTQHSHGEPVVSASVQTMTHRMNNFAPDEFDRIICDEAHHSGAKTYHDIFNYFQPRQLIGFTATPNRSDSVRLDDVFQDIVFERDLKWGIQNGYLSDIYCRRVNIGYDLSHVKTSGGDYAPGELEEAMDGTADAIAQAYKDMAIGATLVFAVSVKQSEEIAKRISGAAVVSGKTPPKERQALIDGLANGSIPCLVNCMVFTEGTDIPRVETVIIARPTQSDSLYTQMVGRGLRLAPGKDKLNLIDCVGATGSRSLCTAPSLLGIDLSPVPEKKQQELEGLLFDLPDKATTLSDCPESWIRNVEIVDLWAKTQSYNTHGVNWFKQPDGRMTLSLPHKRLTIPPADKLGRCNFGGRIVTMQYALDNAYKMLCRDYAKEKYIWDVSAAKRWGAQPASEKQMRLVSRMCKGFDCTELTKLEASQILNRRLAG